MLLDQSKLPGAVTGADQLTHGQADIWLLLALGVAIVASVGSLYLSIGKGLKACPLCFYQRTFVMGVATTLGIGSFLGEVVPSTAVLVLVSPLAVAGLGVAVFHNWLEWRGILECPLGLLGLGTAPQQSLLSLGAVAALVFIGVASGTAPFGLAGIVASGPVLGLVLAVACVQSSPPLPPASPTYGPDGQRILVACERAAPKTGDQGPR